ncbi:MAG TPA: hypothetical protein VGY98_18165, partial [Verrucomicrobiae bacterium]|nr:hypothetical protein [Verrucomicrobiae bacterium]
GDANVLRRSAISSFKAWQRERAVILQRACRSLKQRHAHGETLRQAGKVVAGRYHGMAFKCDPDRKLQLSASTLRRIFRVWTRNGELPHAFRLNFITRQSVFTSPILRRFIQFIIDRPQPSLAVAWRKFCERGGNFGPGRRAGKPLKISYYSIRYVLPTSLFREIAAQQKAIAAARRALVEIQCRADCYARENFPDHPPRKQMHSRLDYQI